MRHVEANFRADGEIRDREQAKNCNLADHGRQHCREVIIGLRIGAGEPDMDTRSPRLDEKAHGQQYKCRPGILSGSPECSKVNRSIGGGGHGEAGEKTKGRSNGEQQERQRIGMGVACLRNQKIGRERDHLPAEEEF